MQALPSRLRNRQNYTFNDRQRVSHFQAENYLSLQYFLELVAASLQRRLVSIDAWKTGNFTLKGASL